MEFELNSIGNRPKVTFLRSARKNRNSQIGEEHTFYLETKLIFNLKDFTGRHRTSKEKASIRIGELARNHTIIVKNSHK